MNNIENSQERTDFMFYGDFYDYILNVKDFYGEDIAEKFALAIIRFGVEGKEVEEKELAGIDDKILKALKATLKIIYPQIIKSKERKERKVLQAKNKSNNTTEEQNGKSSR